MIRAYDPVSKRYNAIEDYVKSLSNTGRLGEERQVTITEHTDGNIKLAKAAHGLITGQVIYMTLSGYDGSYTVTVIDADNLTVDIPYSGSGTGVIAPVMDAVYYIAFLVPVKDMFGNIKKKTAFRGKNIKDSNGGTLIDEIALTEDRLDLFDLFLSEGSIEALRPFQAYSKGILNATLVNEQVDINADGIAEPDYYVAAHINEDYTNQDSNMFYMVENALRRAIESYILKEWYKSCSLSEDWLVQERENHDALTELKSLLMKAEGHKRVVFHQGYF